MSQAQSIAHPDLRSTAFVGGKIHDF